MRTILRIAAIVAGCVILHHAVSALPRFAAQTGAKCQSCHVNPSGGAMRQTFGVKFGRDELPVPTWSKDFEVEDFSNLLTNFLGVGADFRTLYYYRQLPDSTGGKTSNDAFWQMQGDIYLNFRVAKKVNVFLNKGLRTGFEVFGELAILPANGYIKIGKFLPAFGTKLDDHTAYIRTYTGLSPEFGRPELTGAEVAVSPGIFSVIGGIYNAADGFGAGTSSSKAFLGRAEGMFKLRSGMNLGLGANVFTSKSDAGTRTTLMGALGSFGMDDVTIFGEADLIQKSNGGTTVKGVVTYVEANYVITQGFHLKAAYDFYDPDKDLKTGAFSRYSFGFGFFPISGVELLPMYRILKESQHEVKNDEFHLLIHFYI